MQVQHRYQHWFHSTHSGVPPVVVHSSRSPVPRPFSPCLVAVPNSIGHMKVVVVRSSSDNTTPEPADARGAISMGLKRTEEGAWESALGFFEQALTLPGTGLKRFRDKPNLISNGEKMAALYNIACCQSRLAAVEEDAEKKSAHIQNGLVALAGCLECGYDDFNQIRTDDDLAVLRTSEKFEGLIKRFDRRGPSLSSFLPWK